MLKNESALWATLKKHTENYVFWTRIENLATPGIPDLHGVCRGQEAFVELKLAKNTLHISFEPSQLVWFARYSARDGRRAFVVVHLSVVDCLQVYRPQSFLHPTNGISTKRRERIIVVPSTPAIATFPVPVNWNAVVDKVFGPL